MTYAEDVVVDAAVESDRYAQHVRDIHARVGRANFETVRALAQSMTTLIAGTKHRVLTLMEAKGSQTFGEDPCPALLGTAAVRPSCQTSQGMVSNMTKHNQEAPSSAGDRLEMRSEMREGTVEWLEASFVPLTP